MNEATTDWFFLGDPASQTIDEKEEENACQNALSVLPFRPTEVKSNWLKIIATVAEATAIRPHSRTPRIQLINQG
jgi:hypothetical protein